MNSAFLPVQEDTLCKADKRAGDDNLREIWKFGQDLSGNIAASRNQDKTVGLLSLTETVDLLNEVRTAKHLSSNRGPLGAFRRII